MAVLFLCGSFSLATKTFGRTGLFIACVFFVEGAILWIANAIVTHDLSNSLRIKRGTRILGVLLILFIASGNIFAYVAGFMLICEKKNFEYQVGVYASMVELVVAAISALNIFKGYVMSTFFPAMYLLVILYVFRLAILPLLNHFVRGNTADKKLIPVAVLLIVSALGGNLLALLLGIIIIRKVRNTDAELSVNWIDIFKRLWRSQAAVTGIFFIVLLISLVLWANYTFDYDLAVSNDYSMLLTAPSLKYVLGSDEYGRDVFSRVVFGIRISLLAGFSSVVISAVIGVSLGSLAGYYSDRVDNTVMRIMDILMAVPGLLLPIAIITALGTSIPCIVIAMSCGTIPSYARVVRASVMSLKGSEMVEAAKASGARNSYIIFRHILPNSLAPLIVRMTMGFGGSVLGISSLSYLGVGIPSYIPEWGNIMKAGSTYLETASWLAVYPGIAIILLVLAINFLGDGLRDAMDPKLK
jgi:peptide/nickel transport system permease protein